MHRTAQVAASSRRGLWCFFRGEGGALQFQPAFHPQPGARHLKELAIQPDPLHHDLVGGQRAGLVGANDGGGPQGLHPGKLFHQGVLSGQALHRQSQRQAEGGQQPLGHEGHDHADGKDEAGKEGELAGEDAYAEEDGADGKGHGRHHPGHHLHLPLQRAGLFLHPLGQGGDVAQLGVHAGGDDHGPGCAGEGRGAGKHQIGHFSPEELLAVLHGLGKLVGGAGLPGEGAVIHSEVLGVNEAGIRRDLVPGLQKNHIAGNDRGRFHLPDPAVAAQAAFGRQQLLQGLDCLFGPVLLPEAEDRVDQDDQGNGPRQPCHTREIRKPGGGPEQQSKEVDEIGAKAQD